MQSWSYRVHYASEKGSLRATRLEADSDDLKNNEKLALAEADFLIKNLIYDWKGPHPIPEGFPPDDPRKIAEYSFDRFGRRASFATFEGTTLLGISSQ